MSGSNIAGIAVPDPDLFHPDPYIRRGGGGGGGGGGGAGLPKNCFVLALRASVWSTNRKVHV